MKIILRSFNGVFSRNCACVLWTCKSQCNQTSQVAIGADAKRGLMDSGKRRPITCSPEFFNHPITQFKFRLKTTAIFVWSHPIFAAITELPPPPLDKIFYFKPWIITLKSPEPL